MKLSENWLKSHVKFSVDTEKLVDQLTMAGLEVDAVNHIGTLTGVKIARIEKVEPHPNADKLRVCEVNDGKELHTVVCGAPNAIEGKIVPFASVGALLPNDFKIKKAKIRGIESHGMLCAQDELGLGEDSAGLWELPRDASIGLDISTYLDLDDHIIDIDLTPNRGDCLSILGIAREVGALTKAEVRLVREESIKPKIKDVIGVTLTEPGGCARYVSRIIKDIDITAKTPIWMAEKLRRCGIRPRSPVVDVTNFVLLELGQPMHAFDLSKIEGSIDVRYAKNESLELLDDTSMTCGEDTLVIADDKKVLAMAGIMGGMASAVGESTKDVLIESAWFNPRVISGKARKYGKHTDSSHRFERGIDPKLQLTAIERATSLILEICGGMAGPVSETISKEYLPKAKKIELNYEAVSNQLGIDLESKEIDEILLLLGLEKHKNSLWQVPSWRFDLEIQQDLIEEIARIKGYDNLPVTLPTFESKNKNTKKDRTETVRELLVHRSYREVMTYSFVNPHFQSLLFPDRKPINLVNPISPETSVMRLSIWPGLINSALYNLNRQKTRIRIFEIGQCFPADGKDLTHYETKCAGLIYGDRYETNWSNPREKTDYFDLKGDLESMLNALVGEKNYLFCAKSFEFFHPGQSAQILINEKVVGVLGNLHPSIASEFGFKQPVYLFDVDLGSIGSKSDTQVKTLSKFPEVKRDLSFVLDQSVNASDLLDVVRSASGRYLTDLKLFDVYQGKDVENKGKSIALGLTFQHPCRTLTDSEINSCIDTIVSESSKVLGAKIRS
tara:strand:- start:721 stop:3078 length:2358 start_codon:yes stop_codon:yes gene_type:complete